MRRRAGFKVDSEGKGDLGAPQPDLIHRDLKGKRGCHTIAHNLHHKAITWQAHIIRHEGRKIFLLGIRPWQGEDH